MDAIAVPIPHDCVDGFYGAWWRRPSAYLDAGVRAGISVFSKLDQNDVEAGLQRLRGDLQSGRWQQRHADLLERPSLHLGYYVFIAEVVSPGSVP